MLLNGPGPDELWGAMVDGERSDDKLRKIYDAGVHEMESGHYKKAVRLLTKARQRAGGAALGGFISVLLAQCQIMLGNVVEVESARMQAGIVLTELQDAGWDDIAASLREYIEQLYERYSLPDEGPDHVRPVEMGIGLALQEGWAHNQAGSLSAALASYARARQRAHERADLASEAYALTNMGTLCELMNDWSQSLEYLEAALAIEERIHGRYSKARTMQALGRTLDCLRRFGEAAEYSRQAAELAHEVGDLECEANALNNLGNVARGMGQFEEAARHYEGSLVIKRARGTQREIAVTLSNLGHMYQTTGRLLDAKHFLTEAIALHHELGDFSGEALAKSHLAMVHLLSGRPEEALGLLEPARKTGQDVGDLVVQGVVANALGTVYRSLGLYDQAIEMHLHAHENAVLRRDRPGEGAAANNLALDYQAAGDLQSAREWLRRAAGIAGELGTLTGQSAALANQAHSATLTGAPGIAVALGDQALNLAQQTGNRYQQAAALDALGSAELRLGDTGKAADYFAQAVHIGTELGTSMSQVARLLGLAQAEQMLEQTDESLGHYAQAMAELEAQRTAIFDDDLRVAFISTATEIAVDYAHLLVDQGRLAEALHIAERAKARSLLELLAESQGEAGTGHDAAHVNRERGLLEELLEVDSQLTYLRPSAGQDTVTARIKALQDREQRLELELNAVRRDMRRANPRYNALLHPEPWTLDQIRQHALSPGTALLEYVIGEERGVVFAVTHDDISAAEVPSKKDLDPLVGELRGAMVTGQKGPVPRAHELYELLVEPVAHLIADQEILVVPDGPLYLLPFAALLTSPPGAGGAAAPLPYLIRRHAISYAQSASVAGLLSTEATGAPAAHTLHLAAYGDPICAPPSAATTAGLTAARARAQRIAQACPRIPFSANEVWDVADLAANEGLPLEQPESYDGGGVRIRTGTAATKQDITELIMSGSSARFLHLATHGIMDARRPQFSGLLFSGQLEDTDEAMWRTFEILNSRISSELVVLSACDTGLGRMFSGEGVVGLSRAFLCAGAGSVCVSLWRVADASTPELMRTFYQQVLEGVSKRRAMQAAQLAMLDSPQARPSQWAPFVLFGEAGQAGVDGGSAG